MSHTETRRRSSPKRWIILGLVVALALFASGLLAATIYALRLPEHLSEQDTFILGSSRLIPGAPGVLHVQVQRHDDALPVAGANVQVALQTSAGRAQPGAV